MAACDQQREPLTSADEADELALRICELDLMWLLVGISLVLALFGSSVSRTGLVPVSPSRTGVSGGAGYLDKPVVAQVTAVGITVGDKLVTVDHLKDLKDVAGLAVVVKPERAPEVDRLLAALSGLRDAGATVHVAPNQERGKR